VGYKCVGEEFVELRKTKSCPKVRKRVWESGKERGETDFTGLGKMDKQSFAIFIHILLL
jgi:hypothetical protein